MQPIINKNKLSTELKSARFMYIDNFSQFTWAYTLQCRLQCISLDKDATATRLTNVCTSLYSLDENATAKGRCKGKKDG